MVAVKYVSNVKVKITVLLVDLRRRFIKLCYFLCEKRTEREAIHSLLVWKYLTTRGKLNFI
jgi:hypothetical protein